MGDADERHIGEAHQCRGFGAARRFGDATRQRPRQSSRGVGIDQDFEIERRKPPRQRPVAVAAHRDPPPGRQFHDPPRGVQRQRLAGERRQQLVVGAEAPRSAGGKQDGGDVARVDQIGSLRDGRARRQDPSRGKSRMIATTPADILRFALARIEEGIGTILVTLTGIEGTAPRAIGAQMAVAADGRYLGSFSGGCIEAAVVAEAIETLAESRARLVRFGAGSPYLDIRLPCGSGIDLLFNPHPDRHAIADALARLDRREAAGLRLSADGVASGAPVDATGWRDGDFCLRYHPMLRIVAMGQGEELTALARLARAFGAAVSVISPDRRLLADLGADGFDTTHLATRAVPQSPTTDPWTAILSVFHDREWEEELLPYALGLDAFYVGAIGSRRTQAMRLDALRSAGVPDRLCRRLRTSVGLIPAARDPATLALSALAQIVQDYAAIVGVSDPAPAETPSGKPADQSPGPARRIAASP